jgi:hypothetical protein
MASRQVSGQASYNLLDVSASVAEAALNTAAVTSQRVVVGFSDIWAPVVMVETNAEEATGQGGATQIYNMGQTGAMSLNITKMQPNDLALWGGYLLGQVGSTAAGVAAYEHVITERHEALQPGIRDVPTMTLVQRLGRTVDHKRILSAAVNKITLTAAVGGWVTLGAELISTGRYDSVFQTVDITAAGNATSLTLPTEVHGATGQDRLNNVQVVEAMLYPPNGGVLAQVTAVSDADPAVVTITAVGGTADPITYKVIYAPPMPAWATDTPPQPLETALRVKDVCVYWGAQYDHDTGAFLGGHALNDVIKTITWTADNGLTADSIFCVGGPYEERLFAGKITKAALIQTLNIDREALSLIAEMYRKDNRRFAIQMRMTGQEFEAGYGYDVTITFPQCGILDNTHSVDNKKLRQNSNIAVLYDTDTDNPESVIIEVTNKWPQYAA